MEIDDVINSVILQLQKIFGDTYKYYPENVGQGMELPCFYVQYVNGNENYLAGKRYASEQHFVIHGHVENDLNKKNNLNTIATQLYQLEYITLSNGDLIRLQNRNTNIENNEVFFYFDVNVHLIKTEETETSKMESISMNEEVKEDG